MGVSLSVLGPLRLAVDGEEVALPPAQRRVLAVIASIGGAEIDTDALIERVWPEGPPTNARTSLQVHISGIRQAAPATIESRGSRYRLDQTVDIDVAEFVRLVAEAEVLASEGNWDAVIDHGESAGALWRNDPFAELADSTAMRAETVRLTEQYLEIVELRMRAMLALGRESQALPELCSLVNRHPLHERFLQHLMIALYRAGRQVEALRAYQEFRTMLHEEIGIEPDDDLRLLEGRILLQDPTLGNSSRTPTPNNLPAHHTSFIGRQAALDKITARLVTTRLMTITGGPGFGKTRLAVELGRTVLEAYPGGVWFVGLADARTIDDVYATIASATEVHDDVAGLHAVAEVLASRHILLILDNCEHVLEACATFATATLQQEGDLRIVATSRTALGVDGEQVWRLDPLEIPTVINQPLSPTDALTSPAVRLFMDRAQALDHSFALTNESAPGIVLLTRQLAGIPLAIELASRWVPAIGISEITAMLDPTDTHEPAQPGTSLRAAIEWSLALLAYEDRSLVTATAIFSGPFGLSDVRAIHAPEHERKQSVVAMSRIVGSSLLQADRKTNGSVSYRMLVPIREFLLPEQGADHDELRERFAHHYLAKASAWQVDRFTTGVDLLTIDENIENLRAAMDIGLDQNMQNEVATALVPLTTYFSQRYLTWEAKAWIERTLATEPDPPEKATLLRTLGSVTEILGDLDASEVAFRRSLTIYDTLDDPDGRARCLVSLSGVQSHRGDWVEGRSTAEEAYNIVRPGGNQSAIATAIFYVGENLANSGDVPGALPYFVDATNRFESAGQLNRASYVMSTLATMAALDDNETVGRSALERTMTLTATSTSDYQKVKALSAAALVSAMWGDERHAARHLLGLLRHIERSHPDECRDFLLPATAVLARTGDWGLVAAIAGWVCRHFDASQETLPIPWSDTIEQWMRGADLALGDSSSDAATRGQVETIEGLIEETTAALRHIAGPIGNSMIEAE